MEKGRKILIIEDEKPMAHALELKLTHEGLEPTVVHNGEEAILLLEKESFVLVVTDLMMPRVDGFGVLEYLQRQKSGCPSIVLSNLSQEEDRKKAIALGAKEFFVKSDTPIADIVLHIKKLIS